MTVFGRDTIITCLQTLLFGPELARTALEVLAELQAKEDDPSIDAEPGKIVHEVRTGKAAKRWFRSYYGTVDATPLYLVLLSEVWRWTNDRSLVNRLKDPALRALEWIDKWGDRDGDGFVEYQRRSDRGLENQSWKDSGDSQRFADGRFAKTPIAPAEVQGYVFDAKRRIAEIAREVWRDRGLADRLNAEAAELREKFDAAYWVDRRGGYYGLALDADKQPVDSMCSNMGHLLWSGIVPPQRVDQVVDALMGDSLWSGWGVRTMSDQDAAYNPLSYHNGTVWPHDNSLIAWGLARYGRWPEAQRIAQRLLQAAPLLQLPAAGGLRRPAPLRDDVSDRIPDRSAAAGLGGRDAGAAPPGPPRNPARHQAPRARDGRPVRAPVVGPEREAHGCASVRRTVGRPAGAGTRAGGGGVTERLRIAVARAAVVRRAADRLRRHRVGRLAPRRRARRRRPRRHALRVGRLAHAREARLRLRDRAERADRADVLGAPARALVLRALRRLRRDQRPLRPAVGHDRRRGSDAGRAHGARAAHRRAGADVRGDLEGVAERRAHLDLDEPARAEARAATGSRNCPNALDLSVYPCKPHTRRLPALPRPDEPRQGRAPRRRGRDGARGPAEDRRQVPRAQGDRVLLASSSSRTSVPRTGSSSSAR